MQYDSLWFSPSSRFDPQTLYSIKTDILAVILQWHHRENPTLVLHGTIIFNKGTQKQNEKPLKQHKNCPLR